MSEFKWLTPAALTTALSSELNSLANSTSDTTGFSGLSAEIDNEAGLKQYISLEMTVAAQAVARASGAAVHVMIAVAVDNAPTYPSDSNAAFVDQLTAFQLDAATTARTLTKYNIPVPPFKLKLYEWNKTGQVFAASGNTLKYRLHNEQIV